MTFNSLEHAELEMERHLNKLGKTTDEVVAYLEENKIYGKVGSMCACPIVMFFVKEFNKGFKVNGETVVCSETYGGMFPKVYLEEHIQKFIRLFDKRMFPQLVDAFV